MSELNTEKFIVILWEKVLWGEIITNFVNFIKQLANMLTKSLKSPCIDHIFNKLGSYDIYAQL